MADSTVTSPQRVSRYRSQRNKAQPIVEDVPLPSHTIEHEDTVADDSVTRSKSRYRRRPSTAHNQGQVDTLPKLDGDRPASGKPRTQQTQPAVRPQSQRQFGGAKRYHGRHASPPAQLGASDLRRIRSEDVDEKHEDERRPRLEGRYSAQRQDEPSSPIRPSHAPQHLSGELFPPPRPEPARMDGPPTSDQIRATKSMSALPRYASDDENEAGCFGFFKRKRGEAAPSTERAAISKLLASNEPGTIKPGGGGVVPRIDAPISAVNAGDRKVLVECGKSRTMFPVTPTTTPVDIMKSAATCMSERIDFKSAVLLESFSTVGIQRPLRRYEHIRDVMNSWDSDRQNSLILVDPRTGSSEPELSIAGAPQNKPDQQSWFLTFSQKVGKWDKRFVTLRPDGQIIAQKDPDKHKDILNVCHLSDFDVYTPTQEKARKKIKPPKKICFAVKSQQKTSMFESTHDFVHFFCTNDRAIANDFYTAVQGWRSWYLVNVLDEGRKPKSADGPRPGSSEKKEMGYSHSKAKDHRMGDFQDSKYHLGSFKPMDMGQFDKKPAPRRSDEDPPPPSAGFTKSSSQFDTTISPERRTSTVRKKQHPPAVMSNKAQLGENEPLVNLARRQSVDRRRPSIDQTKASPEEFLTTGLLGRTYSQRQRQYNEREEEEKKKQTGPFSNGPNLLNLGHDSKNEDDSDRRSLDGGPRRTQSTRAKNTGGGELQRSNSRAARDGAKPLVDLTPQFREPPQFQKKGGRGYQPDSAASGPLIENATSPEDPLGIPPSTDWRGRNNSGSPHNRTNSLSRNGPNSKSVRRPATSGTAFTGEGLLAGPQGQSGWGGGERGRGVIDGSRAKGPMIDLNESSKFQQGSLLNKVEKDHGGITVPIVDRSRED
ncbi:hypothetical protein LTR37_019336 [Vermiconidia calcicola]|uniref:Uncharacterized protein n=1 Tax=Vermiconidia calcicola TaxID=1690605 RepID=A0ACC3MEH5_9PEZI|nr:hypothetical protein LTR37_019336 [Vermiconidia calcicola]